MGNFDGQLCQRTFDLFRSQVVIKPLADALFSHVKQHQAAIVYSIAETTKANDLKPYEYFEYLLTEISKHMEDTDLSFLEKLLRWSEDLPVNTRKIKTTNKRS
jgi:hypothetical protein